VELSISPSGTGPVCKTLGEGATAREFELRLRGMCDLDGGEVGSGDSYGSPCQCRLTMGRGFAGRSPGGLALVAESCTAPWRRDLAVLSVPGESRI
jgi:hypothetical protein